MNPKRIICVGSRFAPEDAAGPAVYDLLRARPLPPDVDVIDGGLAGLDLARFVDGAERVVFVDSVSGFAERDGLVLLDLEQAAEAAEGRFDHAAGLAYLLRVLPHACEGPIPDVAMVGVEGPVDRAVLVEAAALALRVVSEGSGPGSAALMQ